MENKRDLIEDIKRGEVSSEILNEVLSSETKVREDNFNKKVDIAHKLRQLGAVVAMTASTLGANAQENNTDILPNENNHTTFVVDNDNKMMSYNFYQDLKNGKYGYEEAKEAAGFVRDNIEGVYAIDWVRNGARRDYAETIALTQSSEYFNQNIGIGPISTNGYIYPKTQEASQEMLNAENKAVITKKAMLDVDVTFYTIEAILKDGNIPDEQKESLMLEESNLLFKRVDDGLYDRGNNNDRYLVKRNYLRRLESVNPQMAAALAAEQKIDMRRLRPQELER